MRRPRRTRPSTAPRSTEPPSYGGCDDASNIKVNAGDTTIDPVTTLIIADTIEFTGNTEVDDFDGSAISANPNFITVKLVE